MTDSAPTPITLTISSTVSVSALLQKPANAELGYVLAHGAGAGMRHAFMEAMANGLAGQGIATLRYQFPYMENRSRRPDPPALCHATVRAAVAEFAKLAPELTLFAGGKSFGGRMTSQAQAAKPLPNVAGLVFVGFPLHPAKKPAVDRARHLAGIQIPMLFLQGTRDELADLELLAPIVDSLVAAPVTPSLTPGVTSVVTSRGDPGVDAVTRRAHLHRVEAADHAFHVLARSGRNDAQVLDELVSTMADWMRQTHLSD